MKDQPAIIPAHKDKDGYQVGPKSSCCKRPVVFLDPSCNRFILWTGQETLADLKCDKCSKVLAR